MLLRAASELSLSRFARSLARLQSARGSSAALQLSSLPPKYLQAVAVLQHR
jgi:hypothetical protein